MLSRRVFSPYSALMIGSMAKISFCRGVSGDGQAATSLESSDALWDLKIRLRMRVRDAKWQGLYHAFGFYCERNPGSGRRHVVHPDLSDRLLGRDLCPQLYISLPQALM
jgi:hypothetical protein